MFRVRAFEARTLSWWYEQRDSIDMEPSFQRRGGLWSPDDKAFLVDSILNDFDLPKFYLADFTYGPSPLNKKLLQWAVIDGRQRFEALFGFFEGRVRLPRGFQLREDPAAELMGFTYADLRDRYPRMAIKFDNFNLSVMSVVTDQPALINEMFVRLNRNRPLTGAEIRNAQPGEVSGLIRDLAAHPFFADCARFDKKRGQDSNAAAKLLLTEFSGGLTDVKRRQLDRMTVQAEAPTSEVLEAADRVRRVLDAMAGSFEHRDPILSSQGPVTLYYWLFRQNPQQHSAIRPFLWEFDQLRRNARGWPEVPTGLTAYQVLSRSINDRFSLNLMYQVLARAFHAYIEDGHDGMIAGLREPTLSVDDQE